MTHVHTTCYIDTFIAVAPDSTAPGGLVPPSGSNPSVAARTFEMIADAPYRHTSDDVIFTVWADRNSILEADRERAREEFFSKPKACLRASDLGKKYGWGVHSDSDGRVAVYALGSAEYETFASGLSPFTGAPVSVKNAMRSARR
ncbi:DUF6157 family protein [Microbacterium sp.]|uniref:DUF6157 family protein n=1 Tax=Microbacterium sp. TaxID=51671 RepID=UPI003C743E25